LIGTEKTPLARAVANQLDCNFLKVVSSAIVNKYIRKSARMIREMFAYAKDQQSCVIFMDEIDAIDNDVIFSIVFFMTLLDWSKWTSIFLRYIS
jgi:ATP-dependent 26S proteasome regulatory subunit